MLQRKCYSDLHFIGLPLVKLRSLCAAEHTYSVLPTVPELMKRKTKKTLNLPPRLSEIATDYAEANGRSLSTLIEDLLRRHLEDNGVQVNLPAEAFEKMLADKYGVKPAAKKKSGPSLSV
jgi:hypothetical protein